MLVGQIASRATIHRVNLALSFSNHLRLSPTPACPNVYADG